MTTRPTTVRYRALAWLTLVAALCYLCRNAPGVAESTIRQDLNLTLQQSGWFMGAFFWTYAVLQVPSGWFSQRYGTRISLTIFAVVWSMAAFGIGVAPGFGLLIVAQLAMGVAQAGIFPASCNSIGHWMPISQRSKACGIITAGMQVGAIVASGLTGVLMSPLGWRWVFIVFSLPGILWAIWFYQRFRDRPEQVSEVNENELALIHFGRDRDNSNCETAASERSVWLAHAANPAIWLLCAQQACRAGGYMFFASWFPTFLQKTRGVSVADSGYLQSVVLAGTLTGSILGGMLTDWIWQRTGSLRLSRSGVGAASMGVCTLLILGSWFVESITLAVILMALGALFAAIAGPCAFAATIDIGGTRVPQVFGLMNMSGNLATAACPVLVGKLFEVTANWNLVLLIFAGVYFVCTVCWLFVNPERELRKMAVGPVVTDDRTAECQSAVASEFESSA